MIFTPEATGLIGSRAFIYYDSPDLCCFRAKMDGLKYRRKLRLRIYGRYAESDTQIAMVEIKQRINRTLQKRRAVLTVAEGYRLCSGSLEREWSDPQDAAVASEVAFLHRWLHLEPTCVISYLRTAFEGGQFDPGLRITFDRELTCRGPQSLLSRGPSDQHFAPPDLVIMEVKANEAVPLWVSRLLTRHGCQLRRISKYCAGVATLQNSLARRSELAIRL